SRSVRGRHLGCILQLLARPMCLCAGCTSVAGSRPPHRARPFRPPMSTAAICGRKTALVAAAFAMLCAGCMRRAVAPKLELQQSLHLDVNAPQGPGNPLDHAKPLSGGIIWIDDLKAEHGPPLPDYARTPTVMQAIEQLNQPPFKRIG